MSFAPTIDSLGISAQNLIARNVEQLGLGYSYDYLTKREFDKWKLAFKRTMIINHDFRNFVDLDYRHILDYMLGAMIAKKQFTQEFDGTMPFSGRFGMQRIRANHLGLGDDWFTGTNVAFGFDNAITSDATANWVHGNTGELAGGIAGASIRILESAVFVIVALGDLMPMLHGLDSPIETFSVTVDGKTKPVIPTEHQFCTAGFPLVELDEAIILKNKSTFEVDVYMKATDQGIGNLLTMPIAYGIVYAPEAQMRVPDPANLDGTTNDMLTT